MCLSAEVPGNRAVSLITRTANQSAGLRVRQPLFWGLLSLIILPWPILLSITNEKSQIKYGKWSHRLLSIQRAPHASSALVQDVCINHCGPDIFVTKQLLNCSDVITVFQQVSRKAVSKRMTGPVFLDAGGPYSFFHGTLYVLLGDMMSSRLS